MNVPPFQVRQCQRPSCRFRFPVTDGRRSGERCPHCGYQAQLISHYPQQDKAPSASSLPSVPQVAGLLDNIRSVYNVGSILRTADGAGITHLYLCGITPSPDHPKIAKTALGAEQFVPWTQHRNSLDTALALQQQGCQLWAIEGYGRLEPLFTTPAPHEDAPIVLVVGNELAGVDPELLDQCQRILHIPMQGRKRSLNVATAFGIAAYFVRFRLWTNHLETNL
jgi:tRNA G18 (ribose-2'-O)-methylase SpoU